MDGGAEEERVARAGCVAQPTPGWADDLALLAGLYFVACGVIALVLDAVYALHSGHFSAVSPYSVPVMKWLFCPGLLLSLSAYVGYPRRVWARVLALIMCVLYGVGTVSMWLL